MKRPASASAPARARAVALAVALVSASLAPTSAQAAGYAINDQGTRALSQGLAVVATLEGPETLFYDPAGLAAIDGWQIAGGMTELKLDVSSTSSATGVRSKSSRDHFEIPHLYVARGGRSVSLGLSVNAPFGLATEWPKDFEGRFVSRIADLQTMQVGAMAAMKLPHGWSLGFGPTWTKGDVQLVRDVDLSIFRRGHSAEADLRGSGSTWGWRLGARWAGKSGWRFGFAWHGQADLKLDGDIDYTVVPLGAYSLDQAIATLFVDGPASTTLTLPAIGWMGVGHEGERLTWETALTWTNWSVMDQVIVDLAPVEAGGLTLVTTQFLTPRWHDAWAVRAGVRAKLAGPWSVSGGVGFDESPVPRKTADPLLPDSDRIQLAAGVTHRRAHLSVDLGVQALRFAPLDTKGSGNSLEANYRSSALAFAATVSWRFGR